MKTLSPGWLKKNVNCVLPFVVEENKPRLCVDGSSLSTVGPDEKPEVILDTVADAISMLKEGMVMTKTDDRYVGF